MKALKVIALSALMALPSYSFAENSKTMELSQCLVDSTSKKERIQLVRWIYGAMSKHPHVTDLTLLSETQTHELQQTAADIFSDLFYVQCKDEVAAASDDEVETSFSVLGKIAMQGILEHENVGIFINDTVNQATSGNSVSDTPSKLSERKKQIEELIMGSPLFPARPVWWDNNSVLAVGIIPDGKSKALRAKNEACIYLRNLGFSHVTVHVYDVVKIQKSDEWELITQRTCE